MCVNRYYNENDYIIGEFDDGKKMKIDKEDFIKVSKYQWFVDSMGYPKSSAGRLHRYLFDNKIPQGMVVDHKNNDKLDNRRKNLRICTRRTNSCNCKISKANKSGKTGVYFDKKSKKWRAQVTIFSKTKYIGAFYDLEEAIEARNKAEKEYMYNKE